MSSRLSLDKHSFFSNKKNKLELKSTVLVSAIYNGWLEITRKMIDARTYNVDSGLFNEVFKRFKHYSKEHKPDSRH